MFTVPVSGHVCRTACDSLRISTQVRPVSGNEWESSCTTVAPARRSAAQNVRHDLVWRAVGEIRAPAEVDRVEGGWDVRLHPPRL